MLDVRLLGPFEVRNEAGEVLTPSGQRERAAIALLAIAAPTTVSTDRLADELYGEDAGSDPRNAVQAVISRLRKALGREAGLLETHGAGYRLVDVHLDSDELEAMVAEAANLDGTAQVDQLGEALGLWRGPTLSDLGPSATLDAERFRLDELKASAGDSLLDVRARLGDIDPSLISDLEAATREQPTREGRWALLMRVLYQAGRQADALRAYQRARRLLGEQFGLEPGPALVALEQQILDHDPELGRGADQSMVVSAALDAPAPALPSGTVSVLLCDVEGSVRQWEAAPQKTADRIASLHDIWTVAVANADGALVKSTGDGIMAVFSTAADAITAAVEGQRAHHRSAALKVRVAVNTGPITPIDGDYRGPLVNRCARLLELAAGGQILVTGLTAALAEGGLDPTTKLRSIGSHWLRDVPEPVEVAQVNSVGIASEFPDVPSIGPSGLPRLRTEVLGRDELRADLVERVGEYPLITLLGPGGIGKTTLSLAAAWEISGTRNVVFVDLAAMKEPETIARRIADAVSHSDDDRPPAQRLADRLRTNTDLVVLDNAEHVLDAVADMLDEVLANDLKGSFIVTSRQPLALPGEHVIAVPPLPLPADDADLVATAATPAVALFLDRLQRAKPDLALPNGLLPVVVHICRRLDGIPLAIELAAGRASVLAIEDIAARLDDQLRLLRQVPATRERRHRSLEAVVTWSLDQLQPRSRELFTLLSVFAGDFGMAAVEQVMATYGLDPLDALDQLSELSSASLLSVERGSRFRMLEPIRQLAAAELEDAGGTRAARRAHVEWVTDLLVGAFDQQGSERRIRLELADGEADEIRAATASIADEGFSDIVERFTIAGSYWFVSRDPIRGAELWSRIVAANEPERDELVYATAVIGWCTVTASHPAVPRPDEVGRAIAILDEHDHPTRGLARIVASFGFVQNADMETAMRHLDAAAPLISSDDAWAHAILDMAYVAFNSLAVMMNMPAPHSVEATVQRGERAATTFRHLEDRWALGITLGELGRLKQHQGDLEGAEKALLESVELFGDTEYHGMHYILSEIGKLASSRGDHEAAAEFHRQALEIAKSDGGNACLAVTLGALAASAEIEGDIAAAVGYYEEALALDEAQLKPGVPSAWSDDLERLRATLT